MALSMNPALNQVTPCVGVWIEIMVESGDTTSGSVTPCVGVWIEIDNTSGGT